MEPKKLLQADYLDIVFDERNKSYGGYELRKNYNSRLGRGTAVLLFCIVALSSFTLVKKKEPEMAMSNITPIQTTIIDITPPKPELKVLPPEKVELPKPAATQRFTVPMITDEPIKPDEHMAENKSITFNPGTTNTAGDSMDIGPGTTGKTGTGLELKPVVKENPIPTWIDQMPQFAGDMEAYMGKHLDYPEVARNNNIEGKVVVSFVIDEEGAVSSVAVVRGIGGGCDEAAMRMISGMPKWKPGKMNGKPARVLFRLPIKFTLQ